MLKTLYKSFIKKPKKMKFEGEDNDEEILFVFRKAVITNVPWLLTTIVLLIIPYTFNLFLVTTELKYPNVVNNQIIFLLNSFWYVFVFGYFFEHFLHWFFNVHIITNKRVVDMDFDNLLHRNISEAPLRNVEDTTYTITGSFQTIFNYGSVTVQTAAEQREIEFLNVSNPAMVQDLLSDLVQSVRKDLNS